MNNLSKGLLLGGVFASQALDKSGEVINIDGLDISSLVSGDAYLNSEHKNDNFSNYLGRIVNAKKIYNYKECENEHEKQCFKQAGEVPIVYGVAELFDDEGHKEAMSAASIIQHFAKRNLPIAARFSIEGENLSKEGHDIKRAVAKRVALTMMPCNDSCVSGIVESLNKSEKDVYDKLVEKENSDYLCKGVSGSLKVLQKKILNDQLSVLEKKVKELNQLFKKDADEKQYFNDNKELVAKKIALSELFAYEVLVNS